MPAEPPVADAPGLAPASLIRRETLELLLAAAVVALVPVGALAEAGEPWSDGTYWSDGTGWVD